MGIGGIGYFAVGVFWGFIMAMVIICCIIDDRR